jgi:hypothetical protein
MSHLTLKGRQLINLQNGKKQDVSVKAEDDSGEVKPNRQSQYVRTKGGNTAIDLTRDD